MKKYGVLIGFVLFLLGFISIILGMTGIKLVILSWIDEIPSPFGFVLKLMMMFGGVIFMYISKLDTSEEY